MDKQNRVTLVSNGTHQSHSGLPTPNHTLIGWLEHRAKEKGHSGPKLARELGVTWGYIEQLRRGTRKLEHIGREFAQACARYLNLPTVLVLVAAGCVQLSDFRRPAQSTEQALARGMRQLADDPFLGALVPPSLSAADPEVLEFVFALYQEVTQGDVLATRAWPRVLQDLQKACMVQNEADLEIALAV